MCPGDKKVASQIIIRIDPEVKARFSKLAGMEGKTANQMARKLVEDYIKEGNIGIYIDDLWSRIGGKLRSKGVGQRDISRGIIGDRGKEKVRMIYWVRQKIKRTKSIGPSASWFNIGLRR